MDPKQIVHSDPEIVSGTPVFVGTRAPARALLDYLEGGETIEEFLDDFPSVSRAGNRLSRGGEAGAARARRVKRVPLGSTSAFAGGWATNTNPGRRHE
jgi:hypothetical protein